MDEIHVRLFAADDYPAIINIHNCLNIFWPERPRTAEGWASADQNRNPKCKYKRWVAVKDEKVVGFGAYGQNIFEYHPQRFNINVEVSPNHQRQGIGAALYDRIVAELEPFDPRVLRADAFKNLPQGIRFLQERGFYEAFRETPVHLDIKSFDPSPYQELEAQLRGIAYAREHGYPTLKSCTAVHNFPMQSLFNKLGYARDPEWLQCQKDLGD